jgi:hypothetical protein
LGKASIPGTSQTILRIADLRRDDLTATWICGTVFLLVLAHVVVRVWEDTMTFSQSRDKMSTRGEVAADLAIGPKDREVLRCLATRVAELAGRPIEQEKRDLWYRHNALQATRPLVFCDPENGWNEIVTPDQLECTGQRARRWEMTLRKEVFWGAEMGDDRVTMPHFCVAHVYAESDWGMHETRIGGEHGGSYVWDAPVKDYADLDRLHSPQIEVDYGVTGRVLDLAADVLGDVLDVRLRTVWWWTLGLTQTAVHLRGLEQIMYDMVDQPDGLHGLMSLLRDGHLAKLDFLEENGLFSLNNDDTYVGSGGFGWSHELPQPDFDGRVRTLDMWGFGESQETVGVSPQMFEEFIFPHQVAVLERFGLNCYGCCEPLDKRWHVVERIPRLRRVSVSPWADVADMAEKLGDHYIFSMKPSPTDLAMPSFDEERIRRQIRQALRQTRDCRVEVIMKDNHTIGNDPMRVKRWVQIVREEAEAL